MGGFSNFAISFSIISILTGAVTLYEHGLVMGGPAEMAFGWPLVTLFTLAVALSMAELASSLPTSGTMYHWASRLGGKGWGWFTAWFNIAGQLAALAGIDYGCALFLTPLLGWPMTTGRAAHGLCGDPAVACADQSLRHPAGRQVQRLQRHGARGRCGRHRRGAALFAPKQPLGYFFERVTHNDQGWPYWFAFVIGLLQAQWTYTGYDASASVSEETVDPRRRVPWGIVMAVVVSRVVGYALLLALTLAITDIPSVLNARDASGNRVPAVIAIFSGALGSRAGSLFTALTAMAMWFCGLSAVTWISRTLYAFARDNGLPGSALWRRVSATHQTPAPAIWLCVVIAFVATISAGTYAVVTSISVIGLYFSYTIPVYLAWRARGRGEAVTRGPWHLGRFGPAINLVAMLWVAFISIVLSIPDGMRTGKTIAGLTVLLGVWYLVSERHRFRGPAWASSGVDASAAQEEPFGAVLSTEVSASDIAPTVVVEVRLGLPSRCRPASNVTPSGQR